MFKITAKTVFSNSTKQTYATERLPSFNDRYSDGTVKDRLILNERLNRGKWLADSIFIPWVMVDVPFRLSLTLLRCSHVLRFFETQEHWFRILSDLESGLKGTIGLALTFTGVHFCLDRYPRLPTWLLLTRDGRGEAGTLSVNRQDGQEVAVVFTGEQNSASSVLASSIEQGTFECLVS